MLNDFSLNTFTKSEMNNVDVTL